MCHATIFPGTDDTKNNFHFHSQSETHQKLNMNADAFIQRACELPEGSMETEINEQWETTMRDHARLAGANSDCAANARWHMLEALSEMHKQKRNDAEDGSITFEIHDLMWDFFTACLEHNCCGDQGRGAAAQEPHQKKQKTTGGQISALGSFARQDPAIAASLENGSTTRIKVRHHGSVGGASGCEPVTFSEGERRKIKDYLKMIAPMKTASDFPKLDRMELKKMNMPGLKGILRARCLKLAGKKADLVDRLCSSDELENHLRKINLKNSATVTRNVLMALRCKIGTYGDDGMGDKPKEMCRIEYWLAHLEPSRMRSA